MKENNKERWAGIHRYKNSNPTHAILFYYEGYELTKCRYDLSNGEFHTLYACVWMVDKKETIRQTAKNCDYAYTTLWRRIHNDCKELSPELYKRVLKQIKINLKNRGRHKK